MRYFGNTNFIVFITTEPVLPGERWQYHYTTAKTFEEAVALKTKFESENRNASAWVEPENLADLTDFEKL